MLFFFEFSSPGRVGTEFGAKFFFSPFSAYLNVLDRNNAEMMFLNFHDPEKERNSGLKFFSFFLGLSRPGLDRNNAKMMFFDFLNFLLFIFGIFLPRTSGKGIWD